MKKIITLFVTLCMLLSVFSTGMVTAYADGTDEATLLFELEFSGVEGETVNGGTTTVAASEGTQENIQSGSALSVVNFRGNVSADAPEYHEEGAIKYLTFARDVQEKTTTDEATGETVGLGTYSYTKESARIIVPMAHSLDVANKDALTFEAWVRPKRDTRPGLLGEQKGDYCYLFSFGTARGVDGLTAVGSNKNLFLFNWMLRNETYGGPRFDNDKLTGTTSNENSFYTVTGYTSITNQSSATNGYLTEFEGKWMHIVVTREWIESSTAGTGKWKNQLWINGAYRGSKTGTNEVRSTVTTGTAGNPMNHLVIGGSTYTGDSFRGDIAAFKMYDGVLSETAVRANYEAEHDTYYPANGRKIFGMEINDDGTVTPTADSTAAAVVNTDTTGYYNTENGIKYLTFATIDGTSLKNNARQVNVKLNDYEVSDEDNITVEAWVRPNYSLHGTSTDSDGRMSLFSVGRNKSFANNIDGSTAVKDAYRIQFEKGQFSDGSTSIGTMVFSNKTDRGEKATLADLSAHDDQWKHYVITRTWTPKASNPSLGTWSHKLYVDGKLAAEGSVATTGRLDYSQLVYEGRTNGNTSDYLAIGGTTGDLVRPAFHGDIAEFALYAGNLTDEEIAAKYNASRNLYHPVSVEFKDGNGDALAETNISEADTVKIDDVVISSFAGTAESMAILAVYSGNSLVDYEELTVTVDENGTATIASSGIDGLSGKGITDAKVFVWENVTTLRPLFPAFCLQ